MKQEGGRETERIHKLKHKKPREFIQFKIRARVQQETKREKDNRWEKQAHLWALWSFSI